MNKYTAILLISSITFVSSAKDNIVEMNPNDIQFNNYVHKTLPATLLERIKGTTDVFEIVDGVTYEKAIDLYKRDLDPESNLVIWEEMARVYKLFCKSRCTTPSERMDVYRALLLRSMFTNSMALARLKTKVITRNEAKEIMGKYKLKAKPLDVIQK